MDIQASRDKRRRLSFLYLGRAGAFGRFVHELARCASAQKDLDCDFIVGAGTRLVEDLQGLGVGVLPVETFPGYVHHRIISGLPAARRVITARLTEMHPEVVVTLMPHVWSPIISRAIRRGGWRYATIVHDVVRHPGDPTGWVTPWLLQDIRNADVAITLSRNVYQQLAGVRGDTKVVQLFHPDLTSGGSLADRHLEPNRPFRLLFFGRIMAYKGLPLLIEAVELLRAEGIAIHLGVAGAGNIDAVRTRLEALDAEVVNRWLSDGEASALLARYDAMACSHVEASQSGVAALAFGNCMPVVATPVGGLIEQVIPMRTGILARDATPRALADAIHQLVALPGLYDTVSSNLAATFHDRSMERFLYEVLQTCLPADVA